MGHSREMVSRFGIGQGTHLNLRRFWKRLGQRNRCRRQTGCRACGICCDFYGHALWATAEDLARWREEGRADLLGRVGERGEIWLDPATGERLGDCPFLQRTGPEAARCRIHHTKPALCLAYPTPAHAFRCVRGVYFDSG